MSASATLSISNYTNAGKFQTVISNINTDIAKNNMSHIQINNSIMALSGSTIATSPVHPLDTIANVFTKDGAASLNLLTDPQRPEVVNLSAQGPVNPAAFSPMVLTKYLPPSNIALTSFDKLGKQVDNLIKDSLITQMFHIKGTDILCTTLCLLMSMLPCKVTNKIADDIQKIKDIQASVTEGMQQAIATEKFGLTELNAGFSGGFTGVANIKDVKNSLKAAFNKPQGGSTKDQIVQEIKQYTASLSTVVQVLNLLVSVSKLGWSDPNAILGYLVNGMFDLLENVLMAIQAIAVQMADKIMNKVIAPIEKYFKTYPSMCGIGAQILFKKILAIIYNFKQKILAFIADLFSFQKTARKKFQLFNTNMLWTLELAALLKVLNLLLGNFLDIAIACGVGKRPCGDEKGANLSHNFDGNDTGPIIYQDNSVPTNIGPDEPLNEIATKLQPMVDSIFPGSNGKVKPGKVVTVMDNMPPLIAGMLTNIDLGPNTTVSIENKKATIVYNNRALCGAK